MLTPITMRENAFYYSAYSFERHVTRPPALEKAVVFLK